MYGTKWLENGKVDSPLSEAQTIIFANSFGLVNLRTKAKTSMVFFRARHKSSLYHQHAL